MGQQGAALLVALLVVAILLVITLQIVYTTQIDCKLARNQHQETQCYYAARGVAALAKARLIEDLVDDEGMFGPDSLYDEWAGGALDGGPEEGSSRDAQRGGIFQTSIGGLSVQYAIVDASRKICVNNLAIEQLTLPRPGEADSPLEATPPAPQMPDDADTAEGTQVQDSPSSEEVSKELAKERREMTKRFILEILIQLQVPESEAESLVEAIAERAPYRSISELSRIEGVTKELLWGSVDEFGNQRAGLSDFLTCHSMGAININTASREVLTAVLSERYGRQARSYANLIVQFRLPDPEMPSVADPEGGTGDAEDERKGDPQKIFAKVDELPRKVKGLEDVFGPLGDETQEQSIDTDPLRRQLTVWSRFFSVRVRHGEIGPQKEYSFVLKRGLRPEDPVHLLLWEEKGLPPGAAGLMGKALE